MDEVKKYLIIYLAAVNLISFIISTACTLATKNKETEAWAGFRTVLSFMGAGLGNLLAFVIFRRRATKENMTLVVVSATTLLIYGVALLGVFGPDKITLGGFMANASRLSPWLLLYPAVLSVVTFILFGVDKRQATREGRRIPIVVLLAFSFAGGVVGGIVGMYLFRHKTKQVYFTLGMPLILIAHAVLLLYLIGVGFFGFLF